MTWGIFYAIMNVQKVNINGWMTTDTGEKKLTG
jgi:hypothetical protein